MKAQNATTVCWIPGSCSSFSDFRSIYRNSTAIDEEIAEMYPDGFDHTPEQWFDVAYPGYDKKAARARGVFWTRRHQYECGVR